MAQITIKKVRNPNGDLLWFAKNEKEQIFCLDGFYTGWYYKEELAVFASRNDIVSRNFVDSNSHLFNNLKKLKQEVELNFQGERLGSLEPEELETIEFLES